MKESKGLVPELASISPLFTAEELYLVCALRFLFVVISCQIETLVPFWNFHLSAAISW